MRPTRQTGHDRNHFGHPSRIMTDHNLAARPDIDLAIQYTLIVQDKKKRCKDKRDGGCERQRTDQTQLVFSPFSIPIISQSLAGRKAARRGLRHHRPRMETTTERLKLTLMTVAKY